MSPASVMGPALRGTRGPMTGGRPVPCSWRNLPSDSPMPLAGDITSGTAREFLGRRHRGLPRRRQMASAARHDYGDLKVARGEQPQRCQASPGTVESSVNRNSSGVPLRQLIRRLTPAGPFGGASRARRKVSHVPPHTIRGDSPFDSPSQGPRCPATDPLSAPTGADRCHSSDRSIAPAAPAMRSGSVAIGHGEAAEKKLCCLMRRLKVGLGQPLEVLHELVVA